MTTVGEALVAGLAARGVSVVFGIPGVHTVELYRGLAGSPVRHVTARHEQGAAFMADGYARVSGRPGVAFVITGPGLTNALTAMAQARADSVPMLVISGVNRRDSLGKGLGYLHELPEQSALVATLCPTRTLRDPAAVSEVLDWAFATMATGRPGPVHIEVPTDVMPLPCPPQPGPRALPTAALPAADLLAKSAARLSSARRPLILAGGGAKAAKAALTALAEALDAPVVMTTNARGLLHGHALAVPASPSLDAVRALIRDADQVLAVGTEFGTTDYDLYQRGGMPDLSTVIRIDICPHQLARHPSAIALLGEAGAILRALLALVRPAQTGGPGRADTARKAALAELPLLSPVFPAQLAMLDAIQAAMPGAIIVGDSTQPVYAGNLCFDADRPAGWFNAATGYGALGFAPGAAVGAALAAPGTPVVCLIGDGGLQFSPGELRTAVDEALPITFVVWNNAGFREIAEAMAAAGAEVIGCTPSPLKMAPFAAACDLPFVSVAHDHEALRVALATPSTGPRMVEVRVA